MLNGHKLGCVMAAALLVCWLVLETGGNLWNPYALSPTECSGGGAQ